VQHTSSKQTSESVQVAHAFVAVLFDVLFVVLFDMLFDVLFVVLFDVLFEFESGVLSGSLQAAVRTTNAKNLPNFIVFLLGISQDCHLQPTAASSVMWRGRPTFL